MKVHLIKRLSIDSYSAAHADGKAAFDRWVYLVRQAYWKVPADIIKTFNHADILGRGVNRVVFNIGGNSYRDRKSTRLNSSHVRISYAVFCLKKKKKKKNL